MVSENDTVYLKNSRSEIITVLGTGFTSEKSVEEYIRDRYEKDPEEYIYGVCNDIGSVTIESSKDKTETLPQNVLDQREQIKETAERDPRVDWYGDLNDPDRLNQMKIHAQSVRYYGECDFVIRLSNDIFSSVPLRTTDLDVEDDIRSIFSDIATDSALFMGFASGYASRGRQNPYVDMYGRVNRPSDEDNALRGVHMFPGVLGTYWNDKNLSPVKIKSKDTYGDTKQDIIAVFDIRDDSTNDIDEIAQEKEQKVMRIIDQIESELSVDAVWMGKIHFRKEFDYICAGFKHSKYSDEPLSLSVHK